MWEEREVGEFFGGGYICFEERGEEFVIWDKEKVIC